jgi:hypothetical protein
MSTINIPNFLTAKEVNGLNTYQYTVQNAAMHVASIRMDRRSDSAFTIDIQLNGSSANSITVPAMIAGAPQSSQSLSATMNCAANDVIAFVLTSSAPIDQQLQGVKAQLNVHIGSSN